MPLVVGHGPELAGQQRRAQHRLARVERVGEHDALGSQPRRGQVARRQEGHGLGLVAARPHQDLAHQPPVLLVGAERPGVAAAGHGALDVLIAVEAGHLLGHVGLGGGVPAPGGHGHVQVLAAFAGRGRLEADGAEMAADGVGAEVGAEQAVDPGGAHPQRGSVGEVAPFVHCTRRGGHAQLGGELAEPVGGPLHVVAPVGAPPEPGGGLAGQVQALGGAGHRRRVPPRHLHEHVVGVGADLGGEARP